MPGNEPCSVSMTASVKSPRGSWLLAVPSVPPVLSAPSVLSAPPAPSEPLVPSVVPAPAGAAEGTAVPASVAGCPLAASGAFAPVDGDAGRASSPVDGGADDVVAGRGTAPVSVPGGAARCGRGWSGRKVSARVCPRWVGSSTVR